MPKQIFRGNPKDDPYGLHDLPLRARHAAKAHRRAVEAIAKRPPADLDEQMQDLTAAAFDTERGGAECTRCANCCRTTPPRLNRADADRLAHRLRLSEADFERQYIRLDSDGDRVMAATPCPFLESNLCSVYDARPAACRNYPHTDERRQAQLLTLHLANAPICPAVFAILEKLSSQAHLAKA